MPFIHTIKKLYSKLKLGAPSRHSLRVFPEKKVRQEYIDTFWNDWEKPEKIRKRLLKDGAWTRPVFALSPTVAVTVRSFQNEFDVQEYVAQSQQKEREIMAQNPSYFTLQPIQYISQNGCHLLERVYPGIDVYHFNISRTRSRYFRITANRLKRKGINIEQKHDLERITEAVKDAFSELHKTVIGRFPRWPEPNTLDINTLFLDFDPKTNRVLFALIDTENPRSVPMR
jgi:hypothetical protein